MGTADTILVGAAQDTQANESAQLSVPALSQSHRWRWLGVGGVVALLIVVAAIALIRKAGIFARRTTPTEHSSGGPSPGPWQLKHTLAHNSKVYALAFSPDDRLLATAPGPVRAGLAVEAQIVDAVPVTDADERVDVVVTEERELRADAR